MKIKVFLSGLLLLLASVSSGSAALLTFHDGTTLEGKLVGATIDEVVLQYNFGKVRRRHSQIASITNLSTEEEAILEKGKLGASAVKNADPEPGQNASQTPPEEIPSAGSEDLQKTAYQSLLLLKEKLEDRYQKQRREYEQNFRKEQEFLESKLEELAKSSTELKNDLEIEKKRSGTLDARLQEQTRIAKESEQSIAQLKQELSEANQTKVRAEVDAGEKLQKAVAQNKEWFAKEKASLMESQNARVADLEAQLSEANKKLLDLSNDTSAVTSKCAEAEKLAEQTGAAMKALEKEYDDYKKENEESLAAIQESSKKDRASLEKLLTNGAQSASQYKKQAEKLQEENKGLHETTEALERELVAQKSEIETLRQEKEMHQQAVLKETEKAREMEKQIQKEKENLLKSLVDKVMTENKKEEANTAAALTDSDEDPSRSEEEIPAKEEKKSELFQWFRKDMSRLNEDLEKTKNELHSTKKDNEVLQSTVTEHQAKLQQAEEEKKQSDEKVSQLEKEKQELKSEMEGVLKEIREESHKNLESPKEELHKQYDQLLKSLESKWNAPVPADKHSPDNSTPAEDSSAALQVLTMDPGTETPKPDSSTAKSKNKKKSRKKEKPPQEAPTSEMKTEETKSAEDSAATPSPAVNSGVKLDVGQVSQIDSDFNRIYIDVKEKVQEGDKVYVKSLQGEVPFKIVKVIEALNGAVAEALDVQKMTALKVNDLVYVR